MRAQELHVPHDIYTFLQNYLNDYGTATMLNLFSLFRTTVWLARLWLELQLHHGSSSHTLGMPSVGSNPIPGLPLLPV